MAFHSISLMLKDSCNSVMNLFAPEYQQPQRPYLRYALIGASVVAVAGLGFVGHSWYATSRERAAEKDFSAYVNQYYMAMSADNESAWQQVASLFEVGYAQHKSADLAPYFLAFQADALVQQKQYEQAIQILENVLKSLPESSPFFQLFRMKVSLLILDQPEHPDTQKALDALNEIGSDRSNSMFEIALFYLGRYHFVHHNMQEARAVWQELQASSVDESPSALVQEVNDYLQLVG